MTRNRVQPSRTRKAPPQPDEEKKAPPRIDFSRDLYKLQECADYLGFHRNTLINWAGKGLLEIIDTNGNKMVPVKELLRLTGRSTDILQEAC